MSSIIQTTLKNQIIMRTAVAFIDLCHITFYFAVVDNGIQNIEVPLLVAGWYWMTKNLVCSLGNQSKRWQDRGNKNTIILRAVASEGEGCRWSPLSILEHSVPIFDGCSQSSLQSHWHIGLHCIEGFWLLMTIVEGRFMVWLSIFICKLGLYFPGF